MELKKLRLEKKLLQREVAEYLGIATNTYLGYEKELHKPSPEMLCEIANFYNVTVDEVLGRANQQQIFDDARMPKTEVQELYDRLTPHQQKLSIAYMQCFDDGNRENEQQKTAQQREQTQYKW